MNILLFGPPGAGKGTQSALLKSHLAMAHVSTGDLFRAAIKNQTTLGKKAKEYIDAGRLVPDEITIGLVNEVFQDLGSTNFVLDGFPRNVSQANSLEQILSQSRLSLGAAVFINVPDGMLLERLTGRRVCEKCGATFHIVNNPPMEEGVCDVCSGKVVQRTDDKADVISTRLKAYEESTRPLKDYYKAAGKLVEINGVGETDEVFERLCKVLD